MPSAGRNPIASVVLEPEILNVVDLFARSQGVSRSKALGQLVVYALGLHGNGEDDSIVKTLVPGGRYEPQRREFVKALSHLQEHYRFG